MTPVGYYKLDGNALDSSGNNNNGTGINISYEPGIRNECASFNGTSSYISASSKLIPIGAKTISAWIKTTSNSVQVICGNTGINGTNNGTVFCIINGLLKFYIQDGSGTTTVNISGLNNIADGQWHLVVATWDGTTGTDKAKLYIDGVLNNTYSPTKTTEPTADGNFSIGRSPIVTFYYFNGQIDEVIIDNRAWTAAEVLDYYNNYNKYNIYFGKLGEKISAGSSVTKLLLPLNGNVLDNSGNNNNAVATNISYVAGKLGSKCASFNGTNSRIQIADNPSLTLGTGYTISIWVNPTVLPTIGSPLQSIVCKYDNFPNAGGYDITLYNDSGTQKIQTNFQTNPQGTEILLVTYTLTVGEWQLLNVTLDGTKLKLYRNGVLLGEFATTAFPADNNKLLNIGAFGYYSVTSSDLGRYFNGKIDEVILENRAWTQTEIKKYYSFTKGRYAIL